MSIWLYVILREITVVSSYEGMILYDLEWDHISFLILRRDLVWVFMRNFSSHDLVRSYAVIMWESRDLIWFLHATIPAGFTLPYAELNCDVLIDDKVLFELKSFPWYPALIHYHAWNKFDLLLRKEYILLKIAFLIKSTQSYLVK